MPIPQAEAERWLAMSDALKGQADRIKPLATTRDDWHAIDMLESAARHLYSAFGAVARQNT